MHVDGNVVSGGANVASGYGLKPGFTVSVMFFLTPCLLVIFAP